MVNDVYAGDSDQTPGAAAAATRIDARIVVQADPDPDALARIAGIASLTNVAPVSASVVTTRRGQLTVVLEFSDITEAIADLVRRKLAQLTCVTRAECRPTTRSERRRGS